MAEKKTAIKPTQMRLEPHVLAELDEIALFHSKSTGLTICRTDAVRLAIANEIRLIRSNGKVKKK